MHIPIEVSRAVLPVLLRQAEGFFTRKQPRRVRAEIYQSKSLCSEVVREGVRERRMPFTTGGRRDQLRLHLHRCRSRRTGRVYDEINAGISGETR